MFPDIAMYPCKTELAHQALASHRTLDLRQRRTLILCDGRRSLAELTTLLGQDAPALVRQLREQGYLGDTGAAAAAGPPPPAMAEAARRRSLGAARIYLQDMLELQRNEVAQLLRRRLLMAHDENAIVTALLEALAELPRLTAPGYAQRVRERVAEVLPEVHLPALQRLSPPAGPH